MPKNLRTLLPAPGNPGSSSNSSEGPGDKEASVEPSKRRIGTNNACVECRARKTRCNGERPRCHNCQRRNLSACVYMDKSSRDAAAEVIKILQTLPRNRAYHILERLRRSDHSSNALMTVIDDSELRNDAAPNLLGPSPSSLEEELSTQFPIAYPAFPPISVSALRKSDLLKPAVSAQDGVPHKREASQPTQTGSSAAEKRETNLLHVEDGIKDVQDIPDPTPGTEDYYDGRLADLDISFWTDIKMDNTLAAEVITIYLRTDHPILGVFDPYLFIQDLVEKRQRYCSRFLVSAVLYLGCQMYSAFSDDASEYVDKFNRDTQRLSKTEGQEDKPVNMGALVLVSLALMGQGRDHAVLTFSKIAAKMGMRLGLVKVEGRESLELSNLSDEDLRMCSHAAWGAFCWSVLIALFYRQPHVEIPKCCPSLPIPGSPDFPKSSRSSNPEPNSDGDIMGSTFHSLCEFWTMIHGALWIYYEGQPDAPPELWKSTLAETKYREILAWSSKLPPSLIRGKESGPQVPVFHIWLHAALLDVVRPFTGNTPQETVRWKTFVAPDSSARAAYNSSVNQLKRLVLDYRSNYESSCYSLLWQTGMLYLVNAILESPRDPEWHLYFLLCIYGYEALRRPYGVSATIGKGLLSMTLRDTDMSGDEARRILEELQGGEASELRDYLRATFMADLKMAAADPKNASVENLAQEFETLALFNDLLHQDDMDTS
ncbi:hypothetical protein S40293_03792 [Stachybotrys chartarum IBT 40293]|nr:hypothetical protein S40293_03792 [Stachybotrys chartarum IBT 40293]